MKIIQTVDIKEKLLPLSLTILVIAADQITKTIVVKSLELYEKVRVIGDFLWFWHARNTGMAFSIGLGLSKPIRAFIFIALPVMALAVLLVYYLKSREIKGIQHWFFAAVLGGGLGSACPVLGRDPSRRWCHPTG